MPRRPTPSTPADLARERFGVARLRPEQRRIIDALRRGRDALAVLPTGFGKSLLYQIPAALADRPTVVVSPLLALLRDQEQALKRARVPALRLDSTLTAPERRAALARLKRGGRLLILTTPETLERGDVQAALEHEPPWLLAVDEAHCISEWGHDFRPAYLRLGRLRTAWKKPVLLALTATATAPVRKDIAAELGLRRPVRVIVSPHRANLALRVETVSVGTKDERAGALLRRLRTPAIVYCSTTGAVDALHGALKRARKPVAKYHGRLTKAEREHAQAAFLGRKPIVLVATSAFGMGIDKPDVRSIVHYQVPGSLEQYVQEAGRAGRDGKPARCVLLFDPADLAIQRHLAARSRASGTDLGRVARALFHWEGEDRSASVRAIALSAGVPQTKTGVLLARLEVAGVLQRDSSQTVRRRGTQRRWKAAVEALGQSLEREARHQAQRLEQLAEFATRTECRAALVAQHFGERRAEPCGRCDVCSAGTRAPKRRKRPGRQTTTDRSPASSAPSQPVSPGKSPAKQRRSRVAAQEDSKPVRKRRRRSPRRRR